VLAAERMSQVQLVEARTKADVQKIESQAKAEAQRMEAEAVPVPNAWPRRATLRSAP